ncbi:MAG: Nif3-like dinuclear metal center hexameric protein [Gemmatimonadetes bacterium]|nr:Nif3-like dinuclear metal center hexameric protein [Gemmatimonadota bacterium]MDE2677147.1 Nif3-like dinuclear metal center hexameric protein [Gemmatimonadota bacterium]MXX33678.1 Nif3-like dinuclear metal center hexameric protein [Gemmatimonadota bacterium]MYA10104.1 Nif3-like dinuclear metal center hexameric protein [Gemmatimonadota bacterium]MYD14098.1 Nif3-like dinuclear metal center hexameric protein [Gemmatimonadota bacterium]
MPAVPLAEIVRFLDDYLDAAGTPDYPGALNGLQVAGPEAVTRFAVAVDASEAVIEAVSGSADLLIVHHGLFWGGLRPLTGPRFRRIRALIEGGTALYSSHLPLDRHPEAGNAVILARRLRLADLEPFGDYQGIHVGWKGTVRRAEKALGDFRAKLAEVLGREVATLPGGPAVVRSAAVVTGAGASTLEEAAEAGVDVLVTGEAQHHHAIDAAELGVTVLLGGHYETETFGVARIAEILTDRFGIEGRFVDSPAGQ